MSKLQFTILKTKGKARVGKITLNGKEIMTPVFMPCGTKATIKGVPLHMLTKEYLGSQRDIGILLNNTFHLHLHPGEASVQHLWGLHKFQHRPGLILTDSGWFQVFSLWLSKQGKPLVKLQDDGVRFQSPYDGSTHFFSPEWTVDIQMKLWSDIMMMLDVCSPVKDITKKRVEEHVQITHKRAYEAFSYHQRQYTASHGVLFPIVQGGLYHDLRQQSIEYLSQFAVDGIAVGGLSVGETKEELYEMLSFVGSKLPADKPRYLMGVWTPEDIIAWVEQGIDMFDCVMPTRLGRHGSAFTSQGIIKIKNAHYKNDPAPLDETCSCHTCRTFSRAYLHHLAKEQEMLGSTLLSLHNISYLVGVTEKLQQDILNS